MQGQLSICKGCGFAIRWIITPGLKKMPVNPQLIHFIPTQNGQETFVLQNGQVVKGQRGRSGTAVGYISHFATCQAADKLRKRGGEDHA